MKYDFYQIFSKRKQEELWKMFEEVSASESDPELISFRTYDKFKEKYPHDMQYYEFWGFIGEQAEDPQECSECGDIQVKALYAGFPVKLCVNEDCHNVSGIWSWVLEIWYNGMFFPYFGSYIKILWHWIMMDPDEVEYK
jgi:hypothetical protein